MSQHVTDAGTINRLGKKKKKDKSEESSIEGDQTQLYGCSLGIRKLLNDKLPEAARIYQGKNHSVLALLFSLVGKQQK